MPARHRQSRVVCACLLASIVLTTACIGSDAQDGPASVQGASPSPTATGIVGRGARGPWFDAACRLPLDFLRRIRRGYYPERSPDLLFVPAKHSAFGSLGTASHSGPQDFLQRVPLVFYGPGFVPAQGDLSVGWNPTLADLAPTLAELLGIDFPSGRPGRAISAALLPEAERPTPPKLIVNIVWDGGGWNTLDFWPDAWPFLDRLRTEGTSVRNVTVGSSPSVTPAVHATMGTGVFPNQHGIIDIPLRNDGRILDSYDGNEPRFLEVDTLADLYRSQAGARPKIAMVAEDGWHLGMMGHGAYLEEGMKDVAVLTDRLADEFVTNTEFYSLPDYITRVPGFEDDVREVDLDDGRLDGEWLDRPLSDPKDLYTTPVWLLYQNRVLEALIEGEGLGDDDVTDLLFVNYKQIDHVGHKWNMISSEGGEIVRYTDEALEDLFHHLDTVVGENEWVATITADHGQMPLLESIGALPIDIDVMTSDLEESLGFESRTFIQQERPVGMWLDEELGLEAGVTIEDAAAVLYDYRARDNLDIESLPEQYGTRGNERLFRAAFPADRLEEIWNCATER